MRSAWVLSAVVHAGLIGLTLLAWPQISRDVRAAEVVPIDVITIAAQSDVRATAPPVPEEPDPEEMPPAPETPAVEPTAAAAPPPTPQRPRVAAPERPRPELDFSDLSRQLLEDRQQREKASPRRPDNAAPGERVRAPVGRAAGETASLEAYFAALARAHIQRRQCWRDYADRPDMEGVVVAVEVSLRPNGAVSRVGTARTVGERRAPQAVLDDAERAARACAPYPFPQDENGPGNYDLWANMELVFGRGG